MLAAPNAEHRHEADIGCIAVYGEAGRHVCGAGEGEGNTLNLPLPQGTEMGAFRDAHSKALEAIANRAPGLLIVSFGADTFAGDPIAILHCKHRIMRRWPATLPPPDCLRLY